MTSTTQNSAGSEESLPDPARHPILFFDGECVLCNSTVDLLLSIDTQETFYFATLQGTTADELLPDQPDSPLKWSFLYLDGDGLHRESEAALKLTERLGPPWKLLNLMRIIPRWIRDPVYRFIARHRYRLFGTKDACRAPKPSEEHRFLP